MRLQGAVIGLLLVVVQAHTLRAQVDVAASIAGARAQLDQFNPDSASALLERALTPNSGASKEQRVRAYVLYGIAQLSSKNVSAARLAFRQALQLNPSERVDSLEFLQPENLLTEFNSERLALAPAPEAPAAPAVAAPVPLTVQLALPADTTLPVADARLPIFLAPSRAARAAVAIASAAAPAAPLWADTLPLGATGAVGWDLRGRDGALVAPGRYRVTATAVDSAGSAAPAVTRVVVISRAPADTQALPPPLPRSAFLPEFTSVSHRSASGLLVGVGLGAAVALLPSALGRPELNKGLGSDGTAYLVAGSVAIAGVIAFVAGGQERHPLPENVQKNAALRQQDAASRAAIVEANARARQNAPVRVQPEGGKP
ncbi:MAG: hypothetical protein ABSG61_03855 [Gemmatimonadales bacterium]|jgi:hypothetical protein